MGYEQDRVWTICSSLLDRITTYGSTRGNGKMPLCARIFGLTVPRPYRLRHSMTGINDETRFKAKLRVHGKLINTLADTSLTLEAKRLLLQRHNRKSAKVLTLMVKSIPWLSDSL